MVLHHLPHDPLVPGMLPALTRVLAVGDTARLARLVPNLHLRGYQAVTTSTDPAAAMAGLRLPGGQGFSFDVVMVDITSEYPGRGAALGLFEFAVHEPQLCAYALPEDGKPYGPLEMNDLNISRNSIYSVESNGLKSLQITLNGPYNATTSTTTPILTNSPSSGKRATRNNMKHICDTGNTEVDQYGEHVEKEQQQPTQNPKKYRIVWTDELHKKFVEAYDKLVTTGDAVPKKILALMEDPTLNRENVASHLQKHKLNLHRENHLRTSHSRRKQHRSTPHAPFRSSDKSPQQAPPTIMQSRSATVHVNHLVVCMQTLNTTDKSNDSMLVDVPPKGMFPRDDDPEQNSACCVGNSDENSPQEDDISVILNKDPEPSWDEEFLSNGV